MSSAFDQLARPVQKWIRQQGWRELRDIQARAIRTIYESDNDLIVAASTAGGKTEAAFFPLISQVLDAPAEGGGFDVLYIGPLKALITDQAGRLEGICQEVELPVVPWHGDVSQSVKTRAMKKPKGDFAHHARVAGGIVRPSGPGNRAPVRCNPSCGDR